MTSPDLIRELQASRPTAPDTLRARVREIAAGETQTTRKRVPRFALPRPLFVLAPAAAAVVLAVGVAGVIGLTGPGAGGSSPTTREARSPKATSRPQKSVFGALTTPSATPTLQGLDLAGNAGIAAPTPGRAQKVDATLSVRVPNSDRVSRAAQEALDLARSLGGHVLTADVTTGDNASATLTLRIPVAKTEEAVTRLSALGTIVSQQVSIEDLQERLDALTRHIRSVRAQIVKITARLESQTLDPETRASLELRRRTLRSELRNLRSNSAATRSEARFATVQLSVVTPDSEGVVPTTSRLDRSLDKAVAVLVWEGIVALVILLVAAPLAAVTMAAWLLRRVYRRHEENRLLAAS
jgi:nucleotide-binding universal stress UspA family protein